MTRTRPTLAALVLATLSGCSTLHDAVAPHDRSLDTGAVLTDGAGTLNPATTARAAAGEPIGYLYQPAFSVDYELRQPAGWYVPPF